GDSVEIGRDVQPPHLGVIAGVADDRELARGETRRETAQQLGRAGTARERRHSHGRRLRTADGLPRTATAAPRHTRNREPPRLRRAATSGPLRPRGGGAGGGGGGGAPSGARGAAREMGARRGCAGGARGVGGWGGPYGAPPLH